VRLFYDRCKKLTMESHARCVLTQAISTKAVLCVLLCWLLCTVHLCQAVAVIDRDSRDRSPRSLSNTDYEEMLRGDSLNPDITKHAVENPDCFVEINEPRLIGGTCGMLPMGLRYCSIPGQAIHLSHPDCLEDPGK